MKIGFDYIGITTPFYCTDGKGRILMHKRSTNCRDEHGRWDPGSGKLEQSLSLEQNALQEVKEEYGCDGKVIGTLPAHDIFREQNGVTTHWVAVPFFVLIDEPEKAKIGEPDKMGEIGWFTLDSLPEPIHTGFAHTLSLYRKEFEKILKTV
jgi:8-oxo-dGTP diphosphatase